MVVRAVALLIALTTGAVGVIPSVPWHRCVWTHERMALEHHCDERQQDGTQTTLTAPCCEQVAPIALESRSTNPPTEKSISAPVVIAVLAPPAIIDSADTLTKAHVAAYPRGRPPGDTLARFSSILRI